MVINPEYEEAYFTKDGYKAGYQDFPAHEIRVRKIIDLAHPKSVLDVGGAYGFITRRFHQHGVFAYCMDRSEWCEKQGIIPGYFVRHDMRYIPWPFMDQQFDLAYCEGVLEHIDQYFIPTIMEEFGRVARRRVFQISFSDHIGAEKEEGHTNLHTPDWWFRWLPRHTWLLISPCGTDEGDQWLYKS